MELSHLTALAIRILAENPECKLSGSLALIIQKVKIRREVKDLDFFLPFGKQFNLIEGMKVSTREGENNKYDIDCFERLTYEYNSVLVDVFTPISEDVRDFYETNDGTVSMINKIDIIAMKLEHAFGDHWTKFKHRDDIIHLLVTNIT